MGKDILAQGGTLNEHSEIYTEIHRSYQRLRKVSV